MILSSLKRARPVALAIAILVIAGAVCLRAASPVSPVIRVFGAGLGAEARAAVVIRTADAILEQAGVTPVWVACNGASGRANPVCRVPRGPRDLVVRVIEDGDGPASEGRFTLGYAVVDPANRAGALATVYANRVRQLAFDAHADGDLLLGRAIAHEVGHLLLRSNAHSRTGLLREVWSDAELYRNRADDWLFSAADRAALGSPADPLVATATH